MEAHADTASNSRATPVRIARAACILVAAIGAAVLLGWTFRLFLLKTIFPHASEMAVSTALCLILAAVSLWNAAAADPARRRLSAGTAGVVALAGSLKLIEHASGWSLGIDVNVFTGALRPVQMAGATALNCVISGSALLLCRTRRAGLFQSVTLLGGLMSWLGLIQYFYGGEPLVPLARMVVLTAAAFFVLDLGILCLRRDTSLMRLLTGESPGGVVARRLIPAALFVPPTFGWLMLQARAEGWFGPEAGVSLFALSSVLVFGTLAWVSAALLDRSDGERRNAEARVLSQLERLSLLQQITAAIAERQDVQSIFQAAIGNLEDQLPADLCCIGLYETDANEVTIAAAGAARNDPAVADALPPGSRIAVDGGVFSECARGSLVYEPDLDRIGAPFSERLTRAGLHALVAAPLICEGKPFGVIAVARRQPLSFSSGECEFLKQLSEHISLATHQSELHAALKRAYDELRTTQDAVMEQERLRVLGQMASGIAHDINNAVSPVALYTDLLLESEPNLSVRAREYLEITRRAIEDVSHTIGRMKEFYRRREEALRLEPTDLNRMVRQVVDLTRARWSDMPQQRGIVIDVREDLMPGLPLAGAIESEIREALTNLVFNAVDAMPGGGVLTLRTAATSRTDGSASDQVSVEVSDTGCGMNEEARRRCLEPFFTTKGERGTGLGLAMVQGIVRRHHAELAIESETGRGTTIRMTFSAIAAIERRQDHDAMAVPPHRRILVVDDDPTLIRSLSRVLAGDGHTVVTAAGGQEGIDLFRSTAREKERFAVVITDLGMPHVDGHKVAAAVKAESPLTQVIMLTGWGQRLAAEGVPAHVDHVLSKPPNLQDLRRALNRTN